MSAMKEKVDRETIENEMSEGGREFIDWENRERMKDSKW